MKKVEAAKSQPEKTVAPTTSFEPGSGYSANPSLFGYKKPAGVGEGNPRTETVPVNYSLSNGTI